MPINVCVSFLFICTYLVFIQYTCKFMLGLDYGQNAIWMVNAICIFEMAVRACAGQLISVTFYPNVL